MVGGWVVEGARGRALVCMCGVGWLVGWWLVEVARGRALACLCVVGGRWIGE